MVSGFDSVEFAKVSVKKDIIMKMKMKIGFDISQTAHYGGVAVYTQRLAEELVKKNDLDLVFFYSSMRKPYPGNLPNVREFKIPPTILELMMNKLRVIPIESFIGSVDIFHSSDWIQPKTKAKKVTTYHDVIPLKYPEWSRPKIVAVHQRRLKIVEKEVDWIIAVSEATKRDLLEISKIREDQITVIYEAADPQFKIQDREAVESFRKKYNLPDEFVLSIGGVGERRNLTRVKRAVSDKPLIITGESIPLLDFSEMPLLYSSAKLLLYPSFYEGFGLPVLEAMACEVPVVTSNVSSLPEVGGDACLYADPLNVDDIREKLDEVWNDKKLREDLVKKGLKQSSKFSWQKCASETVDVYNKVME